MADSSSAAASSSKAKPSKSKEKKSREKDQKRKVSQLLQHTLSVRERLRQALSLGIKLDDKGARKWQTTDITVSLYALRTMSAFIGCISSELFQHPLIKDSVSNVLIALEEILHSKSEALLRQATNVTKNLFESLKSSICQYHIFGVVFCLSDLLSLKQQEIAETSATTLKCILTNIGTWKHGNKEIWNVFRERNVTESIICFLLGFEEVEPLESLILMVSLLKEIVWRWPLSRFLVWSNNKLMDKLGTRCASTDSSVKCVILQLYAALALCHDAAMRFLKSKEPVVFNMVQCMERSLPHPIKIEALKLCQLLMSSKEGCLSLASSCCKPITQGIINAMGGWRSSHTIRVPIDQMPLVLVACHAAQITCWPGDHHAYFWEFGIDKLLVDLILGNHSKLCKPHVLPSFTDLRDATYDNLTDTRLLLWNILGGLSAHCVEDIFSGSNREMHYLNVLISCACLVAVDGMLSRRRFQHGSSYKSSNISEIVSASRTLLLMIYSPCKHIATHARMVLSDALRNEESNDYFVYLLDFLKIIAVEDYRVAPDTAKIILSLMDLSCYSSLPEYQNLIVHKEGLWMLSAIIKQCLSRDTDIKRSSITFHLPKLSNTRMDICCLSRNEDQDNVDIVLFYTLHALSQLVRFSDFVGHHCRTSGGEVSTSKQYRDVEAQIFVKNLLQILDKTYSSGIKWYSAYCLSFFGFYGFPSSIGKRMEKALYENEFTDLKLILSDQQHLGVHGVILVVRCPSLLPREKYSLISKIQCDNSSDGNDFTQHMKSHEVHLSGHVARNALEKLLDYVYTGFCQVQDDLVKPVKILAKRCGLKSLYCMLQQKQPIWALEVPRCDLTEALRPAGHMFSDVILEAKEALEAWSCSMCQLSVPHIHAHKVVLSSNCTYLQALFRSGMQESSSQIIKVPISLKALDKLVRWFYSGELPKLNFNCTWLNMKLEMQLDELSVYVELSWLAEFWCLDEVQEESIDVIVSCLRSNHNFPVKMIHLSVKLKQWEILEALVRHFSPLYPQLHDSGELEDLGEVVEMLREGYVRYSQEDHVYD